MLNPLFLLFYPLLLHLLLLLLLPLSCLLLLLLRLLFILLLILLLPFLPPTATISLKVCDNMQRLYLLHYSWGELKLTFSIMALLKRLISTVSMLQKALIRLTPMLFSIFLQKSQSLALLIFDFFFLQFGFAMRRLGEKTVGLGRLTERL